MCGAIVRVYANTNHLPDSQLFSAILCIDPQSEHVTALASDIIGDERDKWEGGVEFEGDLFCVPQCAKRVLRIHP